MAIPRQDFGLHFPWQAVLSALHVFPTHVLCARVSLRVLRPCSSWIVCVCSFEVRESSTFWSRALCAWLVAISSVLQRLFILFT